MEVEKNGLITVTDDTYLEEQKHGSNEYPFAYYLEDVWEFDFHCINWHWHPEVEFLYVKKGMVHCYVGSDKIQLSQGQGMFVNSGVLHRYEAQESVLVPNIVFRLELLGSPERRIYQKYVFPVLNSSLAYQVFEPGVMWQQEVLKILKKIFEIQSKTVNVEIKTVMLLYQLWELLCPNLAYEDLHQGKQHRKSQQSKLHIMMQYIHEHFGEQISLDDIAASIAISKNSALQIFRKTLHISPVSYLIEYRLTKAANLLVVTEKTISVIAEECGFMSTTYFCRKFKEYFQMTPKKYREKKLNENCI